MIYIGYHYSHHDIEWKQVMWPPTGEPTKYSVANVGIVRNDKSGRLMKTHFTKGYEKISITHNGKQQEFSMHRLVALTFIPNPENKPEVNHKDGIKRHNFVDNLEWMTREENQIHAVENGLTNVNHKTPFDGNPYTVTKICELLESNYGTFTEIAKLANTTRSVVSSIYYRRSYTDISDSYDFSNYEVRKTVTFRGDDAKQTKYSNKQIKEVCELIDTGELTLREIESLTGINYQTIRNVYYGTCRKDIAKHYKFFKKKSHPLYENRKKQVIRICELIDEGYNSREIADMLDVGWSTVRHIRAGSSWTSISKSFNFMKSKQPKK